MKAPKTVKERLHQLVDLIDDEADLKEALEYLVWLASDAPETLTEEELAQLEESRRQIAAGDYAAWEDVKRELRR